MAEPQNHHHLVQVGEVILTEEEEGSNFESSRVQTPLLNQNHQTQSQRNEEEIQEDDVVGTDLENILQRLNSFLSLLGFKQDSIFSFFVSWTVFLLIGVILPVLMLEISACPGCDKGQIKRFEIHIVASQACLAAASLICLSHNLRKYGIRKFLFVDRYTGHAERFSDQYAQKIRESVRLLVLWLLPSLILKSGREVVRVLYVHQESWWNSAIVLLGFVFASTYVSVIFLSSCTLFYLVCSLQVIHFEDYGKLLERQPDALVLIQEHIRLRHYLSKISHRFRIYIILVFLIVTVSQFMTLFQTTGYRGIITFVNGGDFAVSSIVQVVGTILCLNAAAKITHRAQAIGSLASQWHALLTCSSSETPQMRTTSSAASLEVANINMSTPFYLNYSESDLESMDFINTTTNTQLATYISSYHKRQALVTYLQANPGGITVYGYTIDRVLINTIFVTELTLVLFVLGKTIVFSSR